MTNSFSFEVKDTDLMGRIGVMKVGQKSFETPCLTPVIHPVWRDIPLSKFRQMGFDVLMTNSYILYKRKREEALQKGLHELIGFDGVLMTDSGGYQVLEYGDTEFTPHEIGEFQSKIGSDLAVTLDRPTGYSSSRRNARETMTVSLEAAKETIGDFGESDTVWVGPIQGGTYGDLVKTSTRGLVSAGFQLLALGSPVELMEGYLFTQLVEMIVNAKKSMPYSLPLHLFGAGHPITLPLSVALGCDTFDSASYMLYAKKERYMTESGTLQLGRMAYLPCSCEVCNGTSKTDLVEMPREDRVRKIALHNLHVLRADVLRCREAITEGRLWDLVEERATVHPSAAMAFRLLGEKHGKWLSKATPLLKRGGLRIRSDEDSRRPELELVREHLGGVMKSGNKRGRIAILVPSSASPPLTKTSGRLRRIKDIESADIFRINPALGPYPAELEFVFPFTQTISDREAPEASVKASVKRLKRMGYSKVRVAGLGRKGRESAQE
ncbi:MAG: tRNA guanosine(15) transglycosylase TgtA [Thaumarchaeota archaeon]|nr:tRNA guanosine(15) transglycosylase TgtA [Nitrososphaerota archaeon]